MWYIYKMENYTAIKNEDIINFAGKWMELKNIILREVTQSQKDMHGNVLTNKWIVGGKSTEYPRYSSQNSKISTR